MTTPGFLFTLFLLLLTSSCFATVMADTTIIKAHLKAITKTVKFRNYKNIDQLNETADYIKTVFSQYSDSVFIQEYLVDGKV